MLKLLGYQSSRSYRGVLKETNEIGTDFPPLKKRVSLDITTQTKFQQAWDYLIATSTYILKGQVETENSQNLLIYINNNNRKISRITVLNVTQFLYFFFIKVNLLILLLCSTYRKKNEHLKNVLLIKFHMVGHQSSYSTFQYHHC